jgi:hypothetical protein
MASTWRIKTMAGRLPGTRKCAARSLVLLLLALEAGTSQACRVPPRGQLISADEQVRLATDVAVGQLISATPLGDWDVEYRFLVLEQLAGAKRKVFTVNGRAWDRYHKDTSFKDHADFAFWARGGGRVMNDSDCVIHPAFIVGNTYLVFLGAPATWRSFEKIDMRDGKVNQDDKWLAYVKSTLAGRPASSMAATERDATPDYERIGRFIYGFHRILPRQDLDRKTLAAQHAPAELLLRVGKLADELDHVVSDGANPPDAELDATLREALAVNAALAAWRETGTGRTPSE